jgi:DNA repair exonuclease SbcCD ATPase subunit
MADEGKKKNIFDRAIDALTDRDEKAAAEAARLEAEQKAEAARKAAEEQAKFDAKRAELAAEKARADAEAARKEAQELQKKLDDQRVQKERDEQRAELEAARARTAAAAQQAAQAAMAQKAAEDAKIKHVWTNEDTYAGLAQKYYGSFSEPYWRLIYNHNKAIIGDHPNAIRTGLEIEIPPLPDELKK